MRLVSAILVLFVSIVGLAIGIAMRTVWAGPDTLVKSVDVEHTAPVIVIPGQTLVSHEGRQTVTVVDSSGEDSQIVVAYGRTTDVMGWVRPSRFTTVLTNPTTGELYAAPRLGAESRVPNPLGSDLWLEQFQESSALRMSLAGDEDISVVIFADGDRPAPGTIQLSWPLNNVSPVAGFLVAGGLLAMVAGFILLALALTDIRRRRGPRRKTPRPPRPKLGRGARYRPRPQQLPERGRRRALQRSVLAVPLLGVTVLTACATPAEQEPLPQEPAEQSEQLPVQPEPYPAVTEAQFRTIIDRVANEVLLADQALDGELLENRMGEPALRMRQAQYTLRAYDSELGQITPVPSTPIRLFVPQQSSTWPRTVFAVVQEGAESTAPSTGLVFRQETARDNYQLIFEVLLAPQVVLPPMPAPDVGSPRLARDSKLLLLSPEETVQGYADVLLRGQESRYWSSFDVLTDDLFTLLGPDGQQLRKESFGGDLNLEISMEPTESQLVALATSDNGALVFGALSEVEQVTPVEQGSAINATPSVRALTGQPQSVDGFRARYEMHVVWYVPPIGSEERIRVVGYSYALVDAEEIDPNA